jgi:hypothetical protein
MVSVHLLTFPLSRLDSRIARVRARPVAPARQKFHHLAAEEREQRACDGELKLKSKSKRSRISHKLDERLVSRFMSFGLAA